MSLATIFSPTGEVWAVAPDDTWFCRDKPWPALNTIVEVCWSSRKEVPSRYDFDRLSLIKVYSDRGYHGMSEWHNKRGEVVAFNPDFWRPIA